MSLQRELASAYKRLGDAQGLPFSGHNLGDSAGALASYEKALQLRAMLVRSDPLNVMDQIDLAATHRMIGGLLLETGDLHAGREQLDHALKIAEPLANDHPDNVEAVRELSADLTIRGEFESQDRSLALPYHRRALEVVHQLARVQPAEQRWQRSIAYEAGRVAYDLALSGRPREAIEYARQALLTLEQLSKTPEGTINSGLTSQLMATHYHLGNAWFLDGNPAEAVRDFRAALSYGQSLSSADPKDVQVQLDVGSLYTDLGSALGGDDRARAGLASIVKGIEILEKQSVADPLRSDTVHALADGYVYKGQVLEKIGDLDGALIAYDKARKLLESSPVSSKDHSAGISIAAARVKAARIMVRLRRFEQAQNEYQRASPAVEAAASSIPVNPLAQYIAADLYTGLGDLASLGEIPGTADGNREACKWYGKSLELWQQLPLKEGLAPNWFEVVSPRHVAEKQAACATLPASGKHQE
jgi:tetratricopeptide (TPR) repeat protein